MSAVYSYRLLCERGFSGLAGAVVPAGFTVVLRDVDLYAGSQLTGAIAHLLGPAGNVLWEFQQAPLTTGAGQWTGRQIFLPGETVALNVTTGNVDLQASGYVLSGVFAP